MEPYVFSLTDIGSYIDDSVSMIKFKSRLSIPLQPAIEELYICIKTLEYINVRMLYNLLSMNQMVPITRNSLKSYCACILDRIDIPNNISDFKLDDLYKVFDDTRKYNILKPLGNKTSIVSNVIRTEFIMLPVIPDIRNFTEVLQWNGYVCSEHNEDLLLQYITDVDEIEAIQLYIYPLPSIILNAENMDNIPELVKLYYPRIYTLLGNSPTVDSIRSIHDDLVNRSNIMFNTNRKYMNNINAFYSVPMEKIPEVDGITQLSMIYNNSLNVVYPMDYIFKTIHTSELIPCIKYCKTKRSDQLFRLYQPQGVPRVSKMSIIKFMNTTGKMPGLSAMISVNKYVYDNNIDIDILAETYIILSMTPHGNIHVYYDTNTKHIIKLDILMDLIKQIMGLFSEVINSTIKSFYHKLPIQYTIVTGREIVISDLTYTLIFSNISMKSIMKVIPYLPAVFSDSTNTGEGINNINIGVYTMEYTRSYSSVPNMPKPTTVTLSMDKTNGNIIAEVTNIPSMLCINIIRDNIIKFMTIIINKPLFTNYASSCVSGYNTYRMERIPEPDKQNKISAFDQPSTIPISTMYSALTNDSEDSTSSSIDDALNYMELLLERNTSPVDQSTPISIPYNDNPDISEQDDIDLGDMGW